MLSPSIQKLIDQFRKFPTVGPRTAARFVFYLLQLPEGAIKELADSIIELKKIIKTCSFCFNHYEGEGEICPICAETNRDKTLLCVVEKETDLMTIEKQILIGDFILSWAGQFHFLKKKTLIS